VWPNLSLEKVDIEFLEKFSPWNQGLGGIQGGMVLYQIAKSGGKDSQRLSQKLFTLTLREKMKSLPRNFAEWRNPEKSCGLGKLVNNSIARNSCILGNHKN